MKRILLILMAVSLIAASCKKEETSAAKVIIVGMVVNSETGKPVKDVVVKWGNGKSFNTVKTDKNGRYAISGVPAGNYMIIFTKAGFRSEFGACNANFAQVNEVDANYEEVFTYNSNIDSLGGTLNTVLLKNVGTGTTITAGSVPYSIYLSPYDADITGTTDANGNITVSNLPKVGTFELRINATVSGYTFKQNIEIAGTESAANSYVVTGKGAFVAPLNITSANILSENGVPVKNFDPTNDIVITLNVPIKVTDNMTSLNDNTITLFGSSIDIDFKKISSDGKTITIRPVATSVKKNTEYTVTLNGLVAKDDASNTFTKTITYKTSE